MKEEVSEEKFKNSNLDLFREVYLLQTLLEKPKLKPTG